MQAREFANTPPRSVRPIEGVPELEALLKETVHGNFPVICGRESGTPGALFGSIRREVIEALLHAHAFSTAPKVSD
jgi:hypothetical protein